MKENGFKPVWKRKFIHTTNSRHDLFAAPHLLERQFIVAMPNQVWVADITYIRTDSGWFYLAAVLDLYSRKTVGWSMVPHMSTELVTSASQLAVAQRGLVPGHDHA
jgi:putative transposase